MGVGETQVSGVEAARFKVIRLDDYADAIEGELVAADTVAGIVSYKDKTGTACSKTFGPHAIKIVPKR